jgi:hypothetical protein
LSPMEWLCLFEWAWRARPRPRLPRPPLLSGWFLVAAWAVTGVEAAGSVLAAVLSGHPAASVPCGAATVLMTGWCGLSTREVRAGWNDGDLGAVRGKAGLEERIRALPQAWYEEKCR